MVRSTLFCLLLLSSFSSFPQVPEYYQEINLSLDGAELKAELHSLIKNTHTGMFEYSSGSQTDTWDILKESDLNVSDLSDVLLIYGYNDTDNEAQNDLSRDKDLSCHISNCTGLWNREHVFAKALASPSLDDDFPGAGTDVHNLRASDAQMNSWRGNLIFEDANGNARVTNNGNFYPGDEWKGDIARIIMYMYVRYPNQCEAGVIGYGSSSWSDNGDMPNVFLEWNVEDPVSDFEKRRNNIIAGYQGNRNPFIDNPWLATSIWNGPEAEYTWGTTTTQLVAKNSMDIYPTLATDRIIVKNINSESFSINIINSIGEVVLSRDSQSEINVSSLKRGFYFLKIDANQRSKVFKFIVE